MIKVSKRDLILDSIIQAYLSDNAPIGSSELGSRMAMSIPASTIRVLKSSPTRVQLPSFTLAAAGYRRLRR